MQAKMKIKPDLSNVRQRLNNASLTMKIKYCKAVLRDVVNGLNDSVPGSKGVTGYFIDAEGNKRDVREISQIIDEVFFPPATPEQAKAAQEYFDAVARQPAENITVIDIPPSKGQWPFD
jgi:hypothetical protein